jgi:hypothetical protein
MRHSWCSPRVFLQELTYNYGIDGYAFGNDLQYIALAVPAAGRRAKALGYAVEEGPGGVLTIEGPDHYRYRVIPALPHRAEAFAVVGLRVASLRTALGGCALGAGHDAMLRGACFGRLASGICVLVLHLDFKCRANLVP